jgi:hypothetical protein
MPAAIALCVLGLASGAALAQAAADEAIAAQPKVFALVAAVGGQFNSVTEMQSTGSHLSPYRRSTSDVENDALNRIVLHSLDQAVAAIDRDSKRVYLSLPAAQMNGVAPSDLESVAIGNVVAALQKIPQREQWSRIVVATPAYRGLGLRGLPGKLQGFGLFREPLCHGCGVSFDGNPAFGLWPGSVDATSFDDETIRAKTYIAPFSYIEVWVLDPKTLAVLDRQERFESQKLAEPDYKPDVPHLDQYLARRMSSLIELSISDAVMHSELNTRKGTVEVGEPKVVDPVDKK